MPCLVQSCLALETVRAAAPGCLLMERGGALNDNCQVYERSMHGTAGCGAGGFEIAAAGTVATSITGASDERTEVYTQACIVSNSNAAPRQRGRKNGQPGASSGTPAPWSHHQQAACPRHLQAVCPR